MLSEAEMQHLRRSVQLAQDALHAGDEPFGSVLVDSAGTVQAEDHNRVSGGDDTRHPEFDLARWAAANLTPEQRAAATVYTSGEHCPMCSAGHALVGLGRIVYATSGQQTRAWAAEFGAPEPSVRVMSIQQVAPNIPVEGPVPELADEVRELHRRFYNAD